MTSAIEYESIHLLPNPFDGAISLWLVELDSYAERVDDSVLSPDERHRAERMRRPVDARRYIASHYALRFLLSHRMGVCPEEIEFRQTEIGKPYLPDKELEFSLSRSGGYALIALSECRPVGIDIEILRQVPERDKLIDTAFTESEKLALGRVPSSQCDAMFLRAWVRKEACLKAVGAGLTIPLSSVGTGFGDTLRDITLSATDQRRNVSLASLEPTDSAVAAIAVADES